MIKNKIALTIIAGLAILGLGFFLGLLWAGNFYKELYTSIHENSTSIDQISGKIADKELLRQNLMQPAAEKPETPEGPDALSDFYFEAGRFAEAAGQYRKALKHNPDDADTYNDLGLALFYSGQKNEAIETLQKAAGLFPEYQRLQLSCGYVLMASGQSDEAKKFLEKAVELGADSDVGIEAEKFLEMIEADAKR